MPKKNIIQYKYRNGMILKRTFIGKTYELVVIKDEEKIKFKIGDKVFKSLTAAARFVCRNPSQQISGPKFWKAPVAKH